VLDSYVSPSPRRVNRQHAPVVQIQSKGREVYGQRSQGISDVVATGDTDDTFAHMSLSGEVHVVAVFDRAVPNKVAGDQLKNLHLHNEVGPQKVETIETMITDDANLVAEEEFLRSVSGDEVDCTTVWENEQMFARGKVEVWWRCWVNTQTSRERKGNVRSPRLGSTVSKDCAVG